MAVTQPDSSSTQSVHQTQNLSIQTPTEDIYRLVPGNSASLPEGIGLRVPPKIISTTHPSRPHSMVWKLSQWMPNWQSTHTPDNEEGAPGERPEHPIFTGEGDRIVDINRAEKDDQKIRTTGIPGKLETFSGVFVPTTLNVLSILMFLRFGFILGQSGLLGMLGMLIAAYLINLVTVMSISAIATNGTVRGGGAYYLISRSLGPEFGGSIGLVFYMGFVFNTGMNALGLIDCLIENFGTKSGTWSHILKEGFWWQYLWATIVLVLCTAICLAGSAIFVRASNALLAILLIATFSIPFSAVVMRPFKDPSLGVEFTGLNLRTLLENLKPHLTKGAAGSQMEGKETFQDLFGILFPATGGIFAGASMSGDLKNPSRSIPKGTLYGLVITFFTYAIVIFAMAASIRRESFYNNVNVIQITNISDVVILLGEFASTFFSSLMGVIGSAKLLQAVARDNLLPGLSFFSKGSLKNDEPIRAILFTLIATQASMLFDINRMASFITMTYLMTFLATNLACFLLKIGSAPNFRPSFHYFNWYTAAAGTVLSGVSMFFVDGLYATSCVAILIMLFLLIHYTSPPKSWGDVSQSLIYHQVRKYLLRLRQEHVKFWRPQILLFVNDFDSQYKMIHFCNSLKKGALFVLGHIIVTDDFSAAVPEARHQKMAWTKFIEYSKVKAFINISVAPTVEWGIRNIVLNSGLGGMRPNIVVIDQYRKNQTTVETLERTLSIGRDIRDRSLSFGRNGADEFPRAPNQEIQISVKGYLTILEDLLFKLRINVAMASGFEDLELPSTNSHNRKKYIDLWPIQMSAELATDREHKQNILTTNFDTYTLILQLGCILHTVPSWKKTYQLRVAVFVEYETDIEEERGRVEALLEKLRIEADVLVFSLAGGDLKSYQVIVNGDSSPTFADALENVSSVLKDDVWWQTIQSLRDGSQHSGIRGQSTKVGKLLLAVPSRPTSSAQDGRQRLSGLKKLMNMSKTQRRRSIASFEGLGVNLGMQTHRLLDSFVNYHSDSENSSSSEESEFERYVSSSDDEDTEWTCNTRSEMMDPGYGSSRYPSQPGRFLSSPSPHPLRRARSAELPLAAADKAACSDATQGNPASKHKSNVTWQPVSTIPATNQWDSLADQFIYQPLVPRSVLSNRFSSSPIPEARVNLVEETGPSIMFADSPPSRPASSRLTLPRESIYTRHPYPSPSSSSASGFPAQAATPLSFNHLSCRAQHLILNELMAKQSTDTAVIFTTLPSPVEGTCHDDIASEAYVSDMDVLCQGLPPCLLVHSNSMTVTMNL